jgi:hypothetical protein
MDSPLEQAYANTSLPPPTQPTTATQVPQAMNAQQQQGHQQEPGAYSQANNQGNASGGVDPLLQRSLEMLLGQVRNAAAKLGYAGDGRSMLQ